MGGGIQVPAQLVSLGLFPSFAGLMGIGYDDSDLSRIKRLAGVEHDEWTCA